MHMRQYSLALIPLRFSNSEILGLSPIIQSIGASSNTLRCRWASNAIQPVVDSMSKSFTRGPSISSMAEAWLDAVKKWMFSNFEFSDLGRPASSSAHKSSLFNFFDLY